MGKRIISSNDDVAAIFGNIEHIDIKKSIEKTEVNDNGKWFINPRNTGDVTESKVYYVEAEYIIKDTKNTYLKNGLNYHKIVIVKESNDMKWKIAEISSVDKE